MRRDTPTGRSEGNAGFGARDWLAAVAWLAVLLAAAIAILGLAYLGFGR